jgi:predicted dithiol-disulfide oxidoreductase (DUF899 family)/predicted metal-binding membrane protein
MTKHITGTREEWLAARRELLKAEKELTRRSDELARQRRELPWVRIGKEYRFETDEGNASLADLFRGRSQLLVYHFMFGSDYTAGCPSCSSIADGFNGIAVHLANHDVMLWGVSRAPLAKLQAYKRRMGWTFPWASSSGGDFNFDFTASFTKEQQREGIEYNYQREPELQRRAGQEGGGEGAEAQFAAMCGTDAPTYGRERPGMSAFVLEDGAVYHTYSTYARSGRSMGHVPVARPRAEGAQRVGLLVAPPRRVQGLREVMVIAAQIPDWSFSRRMALDRATDGAFLGVSALLFALSAAVTIAWCTSMAAMGEMPMPGGWTMSMTWMRMPGQTWQGTAAAFLGNWVVMMVAMMLPSLAPTLWRYREAAGRAGERRRGLLTALVGAGYFLVWTVFGMVVFPLGAALAAVEMRHPALARAVPVAAGVVVLMAGALQFTAWKAHHLACCRQAGSDLALLAGAGTACRHGLRLGVHCSYGCAGLTAILVVMGVMDLRAMAVVMAAITVERVAPNGKRAARAIGAVAVGAGLLLIARAAALG